METQENIGDVDVHETFVVKTDAGELCRLCANTDNQFIPIFQGEGLEHNLSLKIERHLPIIKVTEADKLPLQICYQCASTLISWHNLYEGCRVADKRLRELIAVDDKLYQEDDSCGDFADDFRDDYDDDTPVNLPTETPTTSNLESITFKDNSTKIPTLSETKLSNNETELDESDERRLENYCVMEVSENTIDNFILTVDSCDVVVERQIDDEIRNKAEAKAVISDTNNEETYLCTVCGQNFASVENLAEHNVFVHDIGGTTHPCQYCDREFRAKSKLTQHIRFDHQSSETKDLIIRLPNGKFQCPLCDKVFCRKLNANLHFMSHVAEKNVSCDQCGFRCHTTAQLEAHKKKHEKRFCCEVCSKMFAYKFQLDIHVQGVHYNLRPFSCKLCGKSFKTRYNFGSHMAQHKDIRNFQCPFCPRRCRKNYDLRIHIRTHTGEKPFECKFCQRAYSQNGDKVKHEKICALKAGGSQTIPVEDSEKSETSLPNKSNAIQVLEVDRYPDNEIVEVSLAQDPLETIFC